MVCGDLSPSARSDGFESDRDVDTDELIRSKGGQSLFVRADVAVEEDQHELADRAIAQFGRLDVWVNNAGIGGGARGKVPDVDKEKLIRTLEINVAGTWLGCKAAVARMREQSVVGRCRGRIINMGSVAGSRGQSELSVYSTSKGAVHALTRQLAIECAEVGINVNAIAPGYIPTGLTRASWEDPATAERIRVAQPWFETPRVEDVAGPVVFLASDEAAFITGAIVPVDGGFSAR